MSSSSMDSYNTEKTSNSEFTLPKIKTLNTDRKPDLFDKAKISLIKRHHFYKKRRSLALNSSLLGPQKFQSLLEAQTSRKSRNKNIETQVKEIDYQSLQTVRNPRKTLNFVSNELNFIYMKNMDKLAKTGASLENKVHLSRLSTLSSLNSKGV